MNSKDPSYKKQLYRNLLVVAITITVTAIVMLLKPWATRKVRWAMMTTQERTEDTSSNLLKPQDSVQLSSGKVAQSDFEIDYNATKWYSEYRSNKVAFDKNYQDSIIDILGTISNIKSDSGCSIVDIQVDDSHNVIECSNCPQGNDRWSEDVIKVAVGQEVHIRGTYSASDDDMALYKCHIIN